MSRNAFVWQRSHQQEQEKRQEEFLEAWPFAPHLLKLLDDQVLIATDAQENTDLIQNSRGPIQESQSLAPDYHRSRFSLANEKSGVASLLDSVANQLHKDLREKPCAISKRSTTPCPWLRQPCRTAKRSSVLCGSAP